MTLLHLIKYDNKFQRAVFGSDIQTLEICTLELINFIYATRTF